MALCVRSLTSFATITDKNFYNENHQTNFSTCYLFSTASGGTEGPPSEGAQCAPSLEGPSGPPEAVERPQAARESNKFFLSTLWISSLLHGGLQLSMNIGITVVWVLGIRNCSCCPLIAYDVWIMCFGVVLCVASLDETSREPLKVVLWPNGLHRMI